MVINKLVPVRYLVDNYNIIYSFKCITLYFDKKKSIAIYFMWKIMETVKWKIGMIDIGTKSLYLNLILLTWVSRVNFLKIIVVLISNAFTQANNIMFIINY